MQSRGSQLKCNQLNDVIQVFNEIHRSPEIDFVNENKSKCQNDTRIWFMMCARMKKFRMSHMINKRTKRNLNQSLAYLTRF